MKNTLFLARNRAIFGLFLCIFLMRQFSFAQVAVTPAPFVEPQYFNGTLPCNGCLLYTYAAGTTTPLVTYTDYVGGTPNADPVVMDTNGYPSSSGVKVGVWLAGSAYKLVLKTSGGATIWTVDGVNGLYANFLSLNGGNALSAIADPAASLGKFWLSSTLAGRIKWSDATTLHTIVGADTTDTLTNKTLQSPTITGTPILPATYSTNSVTITQPTAAGTLGLQSGTQSFQGQATGVCTASVSIIPFPFGGSVLTCTDVTGNGQGVIMTSAGTILNLRVKARLAGVNGSSGVITILKNGVGQTVTCTIGTSTTCSDTTHSFTVAAGDRLTVVMTTQAAETLADVSIAFEKQ